MLEDKLNVCNQYKDSQFLFKILQPGIILKTLLVKTPIAPLRIRTVVPCCNFVKRPIINMAFTVNIGEIHYHKGKQNKWSKRIEFSAESNQFEKKIKSGNK